MATPQPLSGERQARSPDATATMKEILRKLGQKPEGPLGEMLMPLTVARGTEIFTKKVDHIREIGRLMNGDAPPFFSEGDKMALRKLWSLFETVDDGTKRVSMDIMHRESKPFTVSKAVLDKVKKSISRGSRDAIQFVEAGPFAGSRATGFLQPDGRLSSILIHTMSMQMDASGQPVEVPNKAILIILPD